VADNPNAIARELAHLGQSDFRALIKMQFALSTLEANRARRCEILTELAQGQPLDEDVGVLVVEPKD